MPRDFAISNGKKREQETNLGRNVEKTNPGTSFSAGRATNHSFILAQSNWSECSLTN